MKQKKCSRLTICCMIVIMVFTGCSSFSPKSPGTGGKLDWEDTILYSALSELERKRTDFQQEQHIHSLFLGEYSAKVIGVNPFADVVCLPMQTLEHYYDEEKESRFLTRVHDPKEMWYTKGYVVILQLFDDTGQMVLPANDYSCYFYVTDSFRYLPTDTVVKSDIMDLTGLNVGDSLRVFRYKTSLTTFSIDGTWDELYLTGFKTEDGRWICTYCKYDIYNEKDTDSLYVNE